MHPRSTAEPPAGAAVANLGGQEIVGLDAGLHRAVEWARETAARAGATVFLVGESGTGKDLFARGIHYAGETAAEPFITLDCAAVPEPLVGPELFGRHPTLRAEDPPGKRGLLELAGEGTLFLDDIHRLGPKAQAMLVQVLASRRVQRLGGGAELPVRCRVIATATPAVEAAVEWGEFRRDLYDRLGSLRINIPPLRERRGDIELLAHYFLYLVAGEHGLAHRQIDTATLQTLTAYDWPGNVRELRNVVERAVTAHEAPTVRPEHVVIQRRTALSGASQNTAPAAEIRIPQGGKSLEQIEHEAVVLTMQLTRGNQSAAARMLGISRPTLARKLHQHGMVDGAAERPA